MTDPWAFDKATPDPGFDGQWADLEWLDEELAASRKADPELADVLDLMIADMADVPPPYGSSKRAAYDRTP